MGKIALIHCDFYSEVLNLSTSMTVILPEQTQSQIGMKNKKVSDKHPTLYLLHGFSDDHTIWTRRTSIERYVSEMGLAVVRSEERRVGKEGRCRWWASSGEEERCDKVG